MIMKNEDPLSTAASPTTLATSRKTNQDRQDMRPNLHDDGSLDS
jgi:hypothetical protein